MNCEKCNGTGNEGFISVIICSDCSGTGIAKPNLKPQDPEPALSKDNDENILLFPDGKNWKTNDTSEVLITNHSSEFADASFFSGPGSLSTPKDTQPKRAFALQPLCAGSEVEANSSADIVLAPIYTPWFQAEKIKMLAFDPISPGTNLRFLIGGVSIGGAVQFGNCYAKGGADETVSDFFYDFVDVDWSVFSTESLARECRIHVFNPYKFCASVKIFALGNPITSL